MRKPIQLSEGRVLCDDGTIWRWDYITHNAKGWIQLPPIPQPEEERPASA